jgi:hypothetical protein
MGQHRCRPDNNRRGRRRRLDDHHRGGGANWRGKPISTEWAIHSYADRHAHQPNAGPGDSPGFSERPVRKPDRAAAGPAVADHTAGAVKRFDLHPHPLAGLSGADRRVELSGADHRVELSGVDHLVQLYADAWRCGCHYGADNAGIASQPRPYPDVGVTAAVDGTERCPTDPRVDPRWGATVRVTGLGETLGQGASLTSHEFGLRVPAWIATPR